MGVEQPPRPGDGLHQAAEAGGQQLAGGGEGVDGQQTERRRAVDEQVVPAVVVQLPDEPRRRRAHPGEIYGGWCCRGAVYRTVVRISSAARCAGRLRQQLARAGLSHERLGDGSERLPPQPLSLRAAVPLVRVGPHRAASRAAIARCRALLTLRSGEASHLPHELVEPLRQVLHAAQQGLRIRRPESGRRRCGHRPAVRQERLDPAEQRAALARLGL